MTGINKSKPPLKKSAGFSLLELMIVVVIIGLIAAYGYSVYTENVIQTRRADAKEALSRLATLQEKFFTECNQYATALTTTAVPSTCGGLNIPWSDAAPFLSADGHYVVTILAPAPGPNAATPCTPATCFLLEADPSVAGASGLQRRGAIWDGEFRLDHAGRKSWDKNDATAVNAVTGMFAKSWSDK